MLDGGRRRPCEFSLDLVFDQFELNRTLMKQDTQNSGPDAAVITQLREAGLRPTRQRIALAARLFSGADRHVTAEKLHAEALAAGVQVSLATVYNTLNQFTRAGLLRELVVDAGRSYFDTNTSVHHHFFFEKSGQLVDVPGDSVRFSVLPSAPAGCAISGVDIIIRLSDENG